MKKILGYIVLIGGIALSLYIGGWVMFVGGIAGLINIIKSANYEGIIIAKNIAKIIFAGTATSLMVWISIFTGIHLIDKY